MKGTSAFENLWWNTKFPNSLQFQMLSGRRHGVPNRLSGLISALLCCSFLLGRVQAPRRSRCLWKEGVDKFEVENWDEIPNTQWSDSCDERVRYSDGEALLDVPLGIKSKLLLDIVVFPPRFGHFNPSRRRIKVPAPQDFVLNIHSLSFPL